MVAERVGLFTHGADLLVKRVRLVEQAFRLGGIGRRDHQTVQIQGFSTQVSQPRAQVSCLLPPKPRFIMPVEVCGRYAQPG